METKTITPKHVIDVLKHINKTAMENSFWDILPADTNYAEYFGEDFPNAPKCEMECATLYVWVDADEMREFIDVAMPAFTFCNKDGDDYVLVWKM